MIISSTIVTLFSLVVQLFLLYFFRSLSPTIAVLPPSDLKNRQEVAERTVKVKRENGARGIEGGCWVILKDYYGCAWESVDLRKPLSCLQMIITLVSSHKVRSLWNKLSMVNTWVSENFTLAGYVSPSVTQSEYKNTQTLMLMADDNSEAALRA